MLRSDVNTSHPLGTCCAEVQSVYKSSAFLSVSQLVCPRVSFLEPEGLLLYAGQRLRITECSPAVALFLLIPHHYIHFPRYMKTNKQTNKQKKPGWTFSQHGLGKLRLSETFPGIHDTRFTAPQRWCQPINPHPVPHRDLGTQHGCLSSFLPFILSSKPSWKKWKADFLLFSRGRRERKKTPQASGQLEATEPSGKESLAGLYDPISRWIVYF